MESKTQYDTWKRFKDMVTKCSYHGIPTWMLVLTFYNVLNMSTRHMIDAATGGTQNTKTSEVAQQLIEKMATNGY